MYILARNVFIGFFVAFYVLLTLMEPLQVATFSLGASDKDAVVRWIPWTLLPLSALMVYWLFRNREIRFKLHGNINIALVVLFILSVDISFRLNGDKLGLIRVVLTLLLFALGYLLATLMKNQLTPKVVYNIILLQLILIVFVWYRFINSGIIYWTDSPLTNDIRPQIGGLIYSTELSNILVVVLTPILLLFGQFVGVIKKILLASSAIILIYIIWLMGSLGTIIFLIGLYVFLAFNIKKALFFIIILMLGYFALSIVTKFDLYTISTSDGFVGNSIDKVQNDPRALHYLAMVDVILSDPIKENGKHYVIDSLGLLPHQNVLGIWVEAGIISGVAYILIVISCFASAFKIIRDGGFTSSPTLQLSIAITVAFIALFLHLKGLVHDTWEAYDIWFFTGALFGFADNDLVVTGGFRRPKAKAIVASGVLKQN